MSADDCFNNNDIFIVIIILVLLYIGRKISESCFLFIYYGFSENITCGYYYLYNNIGNNNKNN